MTSPNDTSQVKVSVVIPFFNEEQSLSPLIEELLPVLSQFHKASEVIFIDDGSEDQGANIVQQAAKKDPQIKLIIMRKNFGQTAAWAAGIDYASGDVLVFLDADLQNDPKDIPQVVSKILNDGYDVVSGWRVDRKDTFWTRRIPSLLANKLISWVTGVQLHDYGCSLKAYRAEIIKNVKLYGEMHRFLPAYVDLEGARLVEIPVSHRPRLYGKSKYGLFRTFKVLLDLITLKFLGGFSTKPLHAFGALGGMSLSLGFLTFLVTAYRVLILGHKEATPMIFLMVVFVITGVQFIMMGLLAEIIVRVYHEAQHKTIYRIQRLTNLSEVVTRRSF